MKTFLFASALMVGMMIPVYYDIYSRPARRREHVQSTQQSEAMMGVPFEKRNRIFADEQLQDNFVRDINRIRRDPAAAAAGGGATPDGDAADE